MNNIAIITARGGSKRVPRKNIKDFMGQPIIKYAIEACLGSGVFNEVIVSTDDYEIAEIAQKCGAKVPFMRSEKTSNDFATTYDVLEEVVCEYKKQGVEFDNICCVYPCVPFLTPLTLKMANEQFISKNADCLMPVVKFSFPIQRALKLENDFLAYVEPDYAKSRSQDLEARYHDVGMFYFVKVEKMLESKTLIAGSVVAYEMDELEIQDIDTLEDWKIAEVKYKVLKTSV